MKKLATSLLIGLLATPTFGEELDQLIKCVGVLRAYADYSVLVGEREGTDLSTAVATLNGSARGFAVVAANRLTANGALCEEVVAYINGASYGVALQTLSALKQEGVNGSTKPDFKRCAELSHTVVGPAVTAWRKDKLLGAPR